jgi:hypothetical protein
MQLLLSATGYIVINVDPTDATFPNDANPLNNIFETSAAITVS